MNVPQTLDRVRRQLAEAEAEVRALLKEERSRRRGLLIQQLHEIRRMRAPGHFPFASQAGQDAIVDRLLKGRRGGSFVDVGAYDGITGSNTLFFETWRGWTGVLVEPVPAQRARAEANRTAPCLPFAVAADDGSEEFVEVRQGFTQMSGLAGSYDPSLLERVRSDPRHAEAQLRVETRTLSRILNESGVPHPDYLSLDIEGGEIPVLEAFPFFRHNVAVWSIENNAGTPRIAEIMSAAGYVLAEVAGQDEIWHRYDLTG